MKRTQPGQNTTIVLVKIAFLCIIAIGMGVYGSIELVGDVAVGLVESSRARSTEAEATQRSARVAQALNASQTARAHSQVGTSTAEAITDSTAIAQARWSQVCTDPFDGYDEGAWPSGEVSDSFTTVNTSIENGKYLVDITAHKYVNRRVWSAKQIDSDFSIEVEAQKISG